MKAGSPPVARSRGRRAKGGGQGRNRTSDTRIFSAVFYQLSYLAPVNWKGGRRDVRVYQRGFSRIMQQPACWCPLPVGSKPPTLRGPREGVHRAAGRVDRPHRAPPLCIHFSPAVLKPTSTVKPDL